MIQEFCDWLIDTPLSHLIADRIWIIAVVQSIHIICITIMMVAIVMLNMRILGVAGRSRSLSSMSTLALPWVWWPLLGLLITGIVLTIAEPARELLNAAFRLKMALLVCVVAITYYYAKTLGRDARYWDPGSGHRSLAVALATVSLAFWLGIVVCGRLIAYVGLPQDA